MYNKDFLKILLVIVLPWDIKREKQILGTFMFFKSYDKKAKVTYAHWKMVMQKYVHFWHYYILMS